ncbi:tyrosine-protein phosphatase [Erysipelothrix sp. D19-032]
MLKMVEDVNSIEHMQSLNDTFIRDEDARNEYRQFFKELLNNREGATYFHCSTEKIGPDSQLLKY